MKTENIKNEINNIRKHKLGLTSINTNQVFDILMKYYKKIVINAPRNIMGYSIDIALANMNGYNRLEAPDKLYKIWGDIYFISLNDSAFVKNEINYQGEAMLNECIDFCNIDELKILKNISFSLQKIIELCRINDIRVKLFPPDQYEKFTTLEIRPYEKFNSKEESIILYLNSMSQNDTNFQ